MAGSNAHGAADVVVRNGAIYTLDRTNPWAEAVAIRDGKLALVGSNEAARAVTGAKTRVVDLGGKMAMPGILDVHNHHLMGGRATLFECTFPPSLSFEQILDTVHARAITAAKDEWIVGGIWRSDLLPRLASSEARRALDAASLGRPVMLRDDTQHNRWVNTRALELAGITAATPAPANGEIVKDGATGEPIGLLFEHASALAEKAATATGPYTAAKDIAASERAVQILNSYGVTGFQDALASLPILAAMKAVDDKGALSAWAVASLPAFEAPFTAGLAGDALFAQREAFRGRHLKPDFVKFVLDGVPTAKTAAFLEPYIADPVHGCCFRGGTSLTLPELARWIAKCEKLGFGVKVHCAGDAAVRQTLDAIDIVRSFNGPTRLVHHIAHASYIDPPDIKRFKELNVVADLCPIIWYPNAIVEAIKAAVPEERAIRFWPNRDLLEAGVLLAAGSDWPVVPTPDPWIGIETMITRRDPQGAFPGALWPEQALDLKTVLEVYTINAARAMGLDTVAGSLEVGKSADLIVLDQNLFEIAPDAIADTKVLMTFFEGRVVHQRD